MERETRNVEESIQSHDTKARCKLVIEGYPVDGLSIAGHETCIIFPSLKLAFDIGRCPQRAVAQDFLFISHAHMDHIGGVPMYVASRGLFKLKPPTVVVPTSVKEDVEKLLEVHRKMDGSELKVNLVGMDIGEEIQIRGDLKVKAFKTYHVIPSQGYVVYSMRKKLKKVYVGLPGSKIRDLKLSGVEVTDTMTEPEIAFTGDTMSDFIIDDENIDALKAKVLILESTFINDMVSIEDAREYGHTHLSEIVGHADRFQNKSILLIHFSARHKREDIEAAISTLPPPLCGRVFALTEGF